MVGSDASTRQNQQSKEPEPAFISVKNRKSVFENNNNNATSNYKTASVSEEKDFQKVKLKKVSAGSAEQESTKQEPTLDQPDFAKIKLKKVRAA